MSYGIIADIDQTLLALLRENLVPEVVGKKDSICICTPQDKGDAAVTICLYDVRKSKEVTASGMVNLGAEHQAYPSLFLNLYYMITVWLESDVKFRAISEHQIMGRIMQIIHDTPILMEDGAGQIYKIKIELDHPEPEEKSKIAGSSDLSQKLLLFYKVYPVEIESGRTKKVNRVANVDYSVDETQE